MFEALEGRVLLNGQILAFTGGKGNDRIEVRLNGNNVEIVANGKVRTSAALGTLKGILIDGAAGDDNVTVADAVNLPTTLNGGSGNDALTGGKNNDLIDGGPGSDTATGNAGNDTLIASQPTSATSTDKDRLSGGTGRNRLWCKAGTIGGNRSFRTFLRNDRLRYSDGARNLDTTISGFGQCQYSGSRWGDYFDGGTFSGNCTIVGAGGNDTLKGGLAADRIDPGVGSDNVDCGPGDDTLLCQYSNVGSPGPDRDLFAGGPGDDLLDCTFGGTVFLTDRGFGPTLNDPHSLASGFERAICRGSDQNDTIDPFMFAGRCTLLGNGGDDTLYGNNLPGLLDGGPGNDLLFGFGGNDTLLGGNGNDNLNGGDGADRIDGGPGIDQNVADPSDTVLNVP